MVEVVLVHGLWYRRWSMWLLQQRLERTGFAVRCFSYPTVAQSPERSAQALAAFCAESDCDTQHLLGHSLGGLVILAMLGQGGCRRPGRVLLLGTPLAGSAVARRLGDLPLGGWLLGHSRSLLSEGAPATENVRCGMIAGTRGVGLGKLSGARLGPSDGTVALAETRHPCVAERVELPVSHTGLLLSKTVARQAAHYLAMGRFARS